ncbi:hypothetical protein AUC71_09985 [Methyloceanibacter marginalis]|uniref:Polysaccharide biosynthesis protein C-terminal domain-containing protein n=1 Tax=Methyloceanibacter marginalis TaxID=1774971 RepID=A0A1E3WC18_9HYPH|nr:hypothetical protein [Methyloceanibacter marginalis]ODS03354.1 hypothetical protein AUC71_09985 [Methyloceanibacter marginalis]
MNFVLVASTNNSLSTKSPSLALFSIALIGIPLLVQRRRSPAAGAPLRYEPPHARWSVVMSVSVKSELGRNAVIYGGALLLPRLAAFVALILFSRLLAPAEYGYFALFVISAELMDTVLLNWIRIAVLRLHPEHETAGRFPFCAVRAWR